MDILLDIHSRLDAQQRDLEDIDVVRERALKRTTRMSTRLPGNSSSRGSTWHQSDAPRAPQFTDATGLEELSKDVWARVARWVEQLPLLGPNIMDTSSDEEEPTTTRKHRKLLNSGKLSILSADPQVMTKVEWPHELI